MKKSRKEKRRIHLQKTKFGEFKAKSCTHKKKYNSDLEALAWGRYANDNFNKLKKKYSTYFCSFCGNWHLTTHGDNENGNNKEEIRSSL